MQVEAYGKLCAVWHKHDMGFFFSKVFLQDLVNKIMTVLFVMEED